MGYIDVDKDGCYHQVGCVQKQQKGEISYDGNEDQKYNVQITAYDLIVVFNFTQQLKIITVNTHVTSIN